MGGEGQCVLTPESAASPGDDDNFADKRAHSDRTYSYWIGDYALAAAEQARIDRMNRKTVPLPADWSLGAPLHVGDKVVFTGCHEQGRSEMEEKAARAGLRVTGSVSAKTKLLVSDGMINGVKDCNAVKLGVRVVDPNTFAVLLHYVQPKVDLPAPDSTPKPKKAKSNEPKIETLVCTRCAASFTRTATRGRKPYECPTCRVGT